MSTNRTEHYQLHAWELGDDFLLSEINENFALLDAKATRVVAGAYTGTGESYEPLEIELGFRPKAVLVMGTIGQTWYANNSQVYGGLALDGHPVGNDLIEITDTGFQVCNKGGAYVYVNKGDKHFIALG